MVESPDSALESILHNRDTELMNQRFDILSQETAQELKELIKKRTAELTARYGELFGDRILDTIVSWVMDEGISMSAAYDEAARIRHNVHIFEQAFSERHNVSITFTDDALKEIISTCLRANVEPATICAGAVKNYEYGLKLIHEKTGKSHFEIQALALTNSEDYLNRLVRDSYDTSQTQKEND